MTEKEVRQAVKDAGVKLLESNLVQGTWGNISIRLDDKKMVVTPSAMDYIRMRPEDTVVVDIETLEYDSPIKPTSEKKIHAAIYRDRPEIGAVIHSHPLWSLSEEHKKLLGGDSVRAGAYGLPGTKKLTNGAVEAIKGRNACFLSNHGIVVCAETIEGAFDVCKAMEENSRAYIESVVGRELNKEEIDIDDIFEVFYKRAAK